MTTMSRAYLLTRAHCHKVPSTSLYILGKSLEIVESPDTGFTIYLNDDYMLLKTVTTIHIYAFL